MDQQKIEDLKQVVRGSVILSTDPEFDETRKIYNGNIDRKPALFVMCSDVSDVIEAVNFGRTNNLEIAVRGGGHSGPGLGLCDDGLVIDLSNINYTRIDQNNQSVRVGGGCTWGDVDHATHAFGMAVPSGIISTTGVGGLTLGGGSGYLTRKFGLTVDNLLEADMVLADGSVVTASNEENSDLYWAIRGGGGNFGIVTSFKFKLHPVHTVFGGPTLWPLEQAPEVMKWFSEFLKNSSEDLYGFFATMIVPPGPPFPEDLHLKNVCGVVWCYTGSEADVDEVFKPIRDFGPPILDGTHPMPFPVLQTAFDALYPSGLQWYWKGDYIDELTDEAIALHIKFAEKIPTWRSAMHLYPIDGAAHRISEDETAWNERKARWSSVIVGVDDDPEKVGEITSWAKDYWEELHPYSTGGAYINFLMGDEGEGRVRATYGGNFDRLASIKQKYDPDNLFRVNHNISPSG